MARKPVPVPRVIPFQPPLPFQPAPLRMQPGTVPSKLREAALEPPSRQAQWNRAAAKLQRLVRRNPYAAGLAEFHIDRLLDRQGEAPASPDQLARAAFELSGIVDRYPSMAGVLGGVLAVLLTEAEAA